MRSARVNWPAILFSSGYSEFSLRLIGQACVQLTNGRRAADSRMMSSLTAYFRFSDVDTQSRFVIQLSDPAKIEHARRIVRGEERLRIHVHGKIVKTSAPYNARWSYHLAPASIDFFEIAAEVCDASIQYVEEHLDEVGGSTLPGLYWCPRSSRLIDEIPPDQASV